MEKKCEFFDFGCKITTLNCQNLSVSQKNAKKMHFLFLHKMKKIMINPKKNGETSAPRVYNNYLYYYHSYNSILIGPQSASINSSSMNGKFTVPLKA